LKKLLVLLIAFVMLGGGASPRIYAKKPRAQKSTPGCYAGYPQGLPQYTIEGGGPLPYKVKVNVSLTYKSAHPENFPVLPDFIVATMNNVNPKPQLMSYEVEGGVNQNLTLFITVYQNPSYMDQHGMNVVVQGPTTYVHDGSTGRVTFVPWFSFTLPTEYHDAVKLVEDAATRMTSFFANGWTCN
jgi:hypothetical protein